MKKKETLFDILLKVSELRMDIETAEKRILRLFNTKAKRKVCPQCKVAMPVNMDIRANL